MNKYNGRDQFLPPSDVTGNLTFEAYLNQMDIGWDQALRGILSQNGKMQLKHIMQRGESEISLRPRNGAQG